MPSPAVEAIQTLEIHKLESIAAPIDIVWETLLDQLGPSNEVAPGVSMSMKLEAWPGGRWYRDLGNNTGHWWGTVQVIKPPKLLEICGPLFMSYPANSHVQYRLIEAGDKTELKMVHKALGMITAEHAAGVQEGWDHEMKMIREAAERKAADRS